MQVVYIEGGFVRKLWDETDAYRDHLLRLDTESRRNRFSGCVADEAIRSFAGTVHGPSSSTVFLSMGYCAAPPICTWGGPFNLRES